MAAAVALTSTAARPAALWHRPTRRSRWRLVGTYGSTAEAWQGMAGPGDFAVVEGEGSHS